MPFGLTNAPATFQRLMESCLGELNLSWCIINVTVPHRGLVQVHLMNWQAHTRLAIYPILEICYQGVVIHASLYTRFKGRR